MSGVNIRYEIASAGGEIAFFDEEKKEAPYLANVIAGEIVNEILENALNIATHSSDTGIHWKEIKETRSTQSINMPLTNISNSAGIKPAKMDNVCSDIVGDNADHVEASSPGNVGEIIDGLNKVSVNQDTPEEKQDVGSLDAEMKKLLTEMLSPPYEIVNYDVSPLKGGVGDQPNDDKSECLPNVPVVEQEVTRTIEKKSRLTDLVKNSPQIITEYLLMDNNDKQHQEEWEEVEEKLVQVIELEHVKPGEEAFRVQKTVVPETVALPEDDDESELVEMPSDDIMDIVDLSSEAFKNEEQELDLGNTIGNGAKGDEHRPKNIFAITPSENASSDGKMSENVTLYNQKQITESEKESNLKDSKFKKKKWNIGTKLWGFLKKGHKQQD